MLDVKHPSSQISTCIPYELLDSFTSNLAKPSCLFKTDKRE